MTLENMQTDESYAIRTSIGKIVFTCETAERARLHAGKIFPEWETADEPWTIVKITTTYETVK